MYVPEGVVERRLPVEPANLILPGLVARPPDQVLVEVMGQVLEAALHQGPRDAPRDTPRDQGVHPHDTLHSFSAIKIAKVFLSVV